MNDSEYEVLLRPVGTANVRGERYLEILQYFVRLGWVVVSDLPMSVTLTEAGRAALADEQRHRESLGMRP